MGSEDKPVIVGVEIHGIDEAQSKAEQMVETIKKAKSLAGDLAEALEALALDIES